MLLCKSFFLGNRPSAFLLKKPFGISQICTTNSIFSVYSFSIGRLFCIISSPSPSSSKESKDKSLPIRERQFPFIRKRMYRLKVKGISATMNEQEFEDFLYNKVKIPCKLLKLEGPNQGKPYSTLYFRNEKEKQEGLERLMFHFGSIYDLEKKKFEERIAKRLRADTSLDDQFDLRNKPRFDSNRMSFMKNNLHSTDSSSRKPMETIKNEGDSAYETVTPWLRIPYSDQLQRKLNNCREILVEITEKIRKEYSSGELPDWMKRYWMASVGSSSMLSFTRHP